MFGKSLRLIPLILALALAPLVTACGETTTPATSSTASVEVLAPAEFAVADFAGTPLVVNFFGSWCGPCNAEAPELASFAAEHSEAQFVGIAVSDSEEDAVAFMRKYGLGYAVAVDDGSLTSAWSITGVPTTIFFTSQGEEVDRIVGAADREQFEQSLAKAQ